MSVSAIYSVWCGFNGPNCVAWIAQSATRKAARQAAKDGSWKQVSHEGLKIDICENCFTDKKAKEK